MNINTTFGEEIPPTFTRKILTEFLDSTYEILTKHPRNDVRITGTTSWHAVHFDQA